MDKGYSVRQIADALGVHVNTIRKRIRKHEIEVRKIGARVVVLSEDVQAYLRAVTK